jgi:hypothetical protein
MSVAAPPVLSNTLADLANVHPGETAWLFGKGPSFERVDWDCVHGVTIGINDVGLVIPACDYLVASDPIKPWLDKYLAEGRSIQPDMIWVLPTHIEVPAAIDPHQVVRWVTQPYHEHPLEWDVETIVARNGLLMRGGTAVTAAHLCRLMGICHIVTAGIDGGPGHGRKWWIDPAAGGTYSAIKFDYLETCKSLGIGTNHFESLV